MNERTPVLGEHPAPPRPQHLLALLLACVIGVLVLAPPVASAQNTVVSSIPEDGAVLDESPAELSITFAQELGDANTIALECETELVTLPRPSVGDDGVTLTVEIPEPVGRGTCVARWRVSDADGEPAGSGAITFIVQDEAAPGGTADSTPEDSAPEDTTPATTDAAGEADTGGDAAPDSGADDEVIPLAEVDTAQGPLWLGRMLSVTGLAIVFGALVLIAAAWPEGVEYLITVRFVRAMWVVALVGTVLYTMAAAGAVNGGSLASGVNPVTWLDLLDAGWPGRVLLVRLLLVVLSVWAALRPDRVIDPATQMAALAIPGLAVATIGFARTEGDLAVLGVAMGILHALAMAIWVGGTVLLARVVLAGPGEEDLVHPVRGYSRLSNAAIVITIVTGIVQMIRLDGGNLFSSTHGRVLLLKSVVVAAMLFVAMSARQFVNRRLARANEMTVPLADRLRRAFGVEAAFGVAAVALSAWLLALDPPNIDTTPTIDYAIERRFEVEEAQFDVTVKLTNDSVGRAGMEVVVDDPETGLSNLEVVLTAPENDQDVGTITQPVPLGGRGVAVRLERNGLPLNFPGDWTMEVSAVTPDGAVSTDPWQFTLLDADGSVPTSAITLPPASTVVVTIPADDDEG